MGGGGPAGTGWEVGQPVLVSDLFRALMPADDVGTIARLQIRRLVVMDCVPIQGESDRLASRFRDVDEYRVGEIKALWNQALFRLARKKRHSVGSRSRPDSPQASSIQGKCKQRRTDGRREQTNQSTLSALTGSKR